MKRIFIWTISAYRFLFKGHISHCRFIPTCSEYSINAILKYGSAIGILMTFKRILKCHPFHNGGYDPVP